MLWLSHHVPTEMLRNTITEIALTVVTVTNIGLLCQDQDETTTFTILEKVTSPTNGTPGETSTITGITLNFVSQLYPKTTNDINVPALSVALEKMQLL